MGRECFGSARRAGAAPRGALGRPTAHLALAVTARARSWLKDLNDRLSLPQQEASLHLVGTARTAPSWATPRGTSWSVASVEEARTAPAAGRARLDAPKTISTASLGATRVPTAAGAPAGLPPGPAVSASGQDPEEGSRSPRPSPAEGLPAWRF